MKTGIFFVFILAISTLEVKSMKSYKNHRVVTFNIENEKQLEEIQTLEMQPGFVFLDPPVQVNMKIDIVIQPEMLASFEEIALATKIDFKISTDDLQSWIDIEKPLKTRKAFTLDSYNELEDIYQFLDDMQANYPELATVYTIGESYEGRPMKVIKISTNENNPSIFFEAGIHAREWIAPATALWLINELITSTDASVRELVNSITFYFLPVTNPDGYKFTHEENRLWRKTRSHPNLLCTGVDANRNFEFNFNMGGSSKLACTDTFMGPHPFSEKEIVAMMDFYATIADKTDAYISFHSAAQMLLYPMGHTSSRDEVPNWEHLHAIAEYAIQALTAVHGTPYVYGDTASTIYVASGTSVDHVYGHFGTPLAYTYEFRAGPASPSRFILPPEQIKDNSEEILVSLTAFIEKAKELGYFTMKG